jgi:hypothetical protein
VAKVTVDVFVSYTSADRPWAEWIAWELEAAGYSTLIQAWDFGAGSNFVVEMHQAARVATRDGRGALAGVLGVAVRVGGVGGRVSRGSDR